MCHRTFLAARSPEPAPLGRYGCIQHGRMEPG